MLIFYVYLFKNGWSLNLFIFEFLIIWRFFRIKVGLLLFILLYFLWGLLCLEIIFIYIFRIMFFLCFDEFVVFLGGVVSMLILVYFCLYCFESRFDKKFGYGFILRSYSNLFYFRVLCCFFYVIMNRISFILSKI